VLFAWSGCCIAQYKIPRTLLCALFHERLSHECRVMTATTARSGIPLSTETPCSVQNEVGWLRVMWQRLLPVPGVCSALEPGPCSRLPSYRDGSRISSGSLRQIRRSTRVPDWRARRASRIARNSRGPYRICTASGTGSSTPSASLPHSSIDLTVTISSVGGDPAYPTERDYPRSCPLYSPCASVSQACEHANSRFLQPGTAHRAANSRHSYVTGGRGPRPDTTGSDKSKNGTAAAPWRVRR
jgi:hypothetical protein